MSKFMNPRRIDFTKKRRKHCKSRSEWTQEVQERLQALQLARQAYLNSRSRSCFKQ